MKNSKHIGDPGCAGGTWQVTSVTKDHAASCQPSLVTRHPLGGSCHLSPVTRHSRRAFSLIELLTVIAVMAVLAGLTLVVVRPITKLKYRNIATAELNQIENALDNYKAKYGVYPPSNANAALSTLPQLYYELSGVVNNGAVFTTLDGSASIASGQVQSAFGVGGFINCTKGGGDDATPAKNFLPGLKPNRIAQAQNVSLLVTSVNGPDPQYQPLGAMNINPFRYTYPGVNNPNSYDLYVVLVISGQTNLICNWSKSVILNQPMP